MKQCPECGENLADDAVHCGHCGTQVEEEEVDENNQTMFGVGALSDEDLEQMEAGGEPGGDTGGSEESADSDDDGFRLPTPGEMGEGEAEGDASETGADTSGEDRPGLKSSGSEDEAALAETEALPSLEDDDSAGRQQEGTDLEEGRLSSPGESDGDGDLRGSPDLSAESAPAASEGSPFADDEKPGGGALTGESETDPQPPKDASKPEAASGDGLAADTGEMESDLAGGGGDVGGLDPGGEAPDSGEAMPETGGDSPGPVVSNEQPQSGSGPEPGGGAPASGLDAGEEESPPPAGGDGGAPPRPEADTPSDLSSPDEPGAGEPQSTAEEAESPAPSRNPMAEDQRFGGGGGGQQESAPSGGSPQGPAGQPQDPSGQPGGQPVAGGGQEPPGTGGQQQPSGTPQQSAGGQRRRQPTEHQSGDSGNKTIFLILGALVGLFLLFVAGLIGAAFFFGWI